MDDTTARAETEPQAAAPVRRGLTVMLAVVAVAVLTADQLTKAWAVQQLTGRAPLAVVDGWLQFRLVRNPGAAFSMATGMTWVLTVIAVSVSVAIVRMSRRLGSRWWALALGLLLGGAVGNLTDRLLRAPGFARGHVVDFIEYQRFPFMEFPVFNVADSCVVSAAVLIALLAFAGVGLDGRRAEG